MAPLAIKNIIFSRHHMAFRHLILSDLYSWRICNLRFNSSDTERNIKLISKHLKISESKAQYLLFKYPVFKKYNDEQIKNLLNTLYDLGLPRNTILEEPALASMLPITLKFRYAVLEECGFSNISGKAIVSYLQLIKQRTIGELKKSGLIPNSLNVENKLASYMTYWPSSLTTLIYGDSDESTLYLLRLKIIQRYLELVLDLTQDAFDRGLHTYQTIRHRPLRCINETLKILQNDIHMSPQKIKSNFYLLHCDPDNLKNILYKFRSIGGINIREILRMHPKLAMIKCCTMVEIKKLLEDYGFNEAAQIRCFQIYTLSPATIKERLDKAKTIPEFNTFYNHPRFLKMIHYNKTAQARLMKLYNNNKKCLSLNILSGSSAHYEVFEKAPGDRLGKGNDLVFCITKALGNPYSTVSVRNVLKRHPFWINIPLIQVKYVYEQLSAEFSASDIYENCPILLYPWNKIRDILNFLQNKQNKLSSTLLHEQIDLSVISKSQKLSLILYTLEKNHYFTGNGVWSEEKHKNIVDLTTQTRNANQLVQ